MIRICALALILALAGGCATSVKPWERGILAKRHMALEADANLAALRRHCEFSKEGASGGYGGGAGGCGCN